MRYLIPSLFSAIALLAVAPTDSRGEPSWGERPLTYKSPSGHSPLTTFPRVSLLKTSEEVLFEKMAPWVYVESKLVEGIPMGRFFNTTTRRKTGWMRAGESLEGASLVALNADRARFVYRDSYQDLLFVPEKAPMYDSSRKRTPSEIAAAQRRYSEFYMKKFIVSGKEYARQRGNVSAPQPLRYPKP